MGVYPAQEEGKHQRSENPAVKPRGKEEPFTVLIRSQRGLSNSENSMNTALHAQRWGWNHGHGERPGPTSIHLQCRGFGLGGNPPSLEKWSHKNPALPPLLWHTQQFAQVRLQPSPTFCHGEEKNVVTKSKFWPERAHKRSCTRVKPRAGAQSSTELLSVSWLMEKLIFVGGGRLG